MKINKIFGHRVIFLIFSIHLLIFMSCTRCVLPGSDSSHDKIIVMSYNAQNIFDDSDNGSEYPEFDPSTSDWGTGEYNTRLSNLAEVIRRSCSDGPDVIALQEIENQRVVEDLIEYYLKGMEYNYIAVTDTPDSAIQLGILSRFKLDDIIVHQIFMDGKIIGRPILEAFVQTDKSGFYIFNNHWKSKLGGSEETEISRIEAARLLSRRISELKVKDENAEIIALGDFNENWDESRRINSEYDTALIPLEDFFIGNSIGTICIAAVKTDFQLEKDLDRIILFSPWRSYLERAGSYEYNNVWDTIDNTMLTSSLFDDNNLEYKSFRVMSNDFLLTSQGYPNKWKTNTGYGYSDHLPVLLYLEILNN